jgi:hypothetical protein
MRYLWYFDYICGILILTILYTNPETNDMAKSSIKNQFFYDFYSKNKCIYIYFINFVAK